MTTDLQSRLESLPHPRPDYAPIPPALANQAHTVEALYIHVPFCTSKCHYCDFYSIAGHLDQTPAYLAALQNEITLWTAHLGKIAPKTIFIGGGTPTLLPPPQLTQLLTLITNNINPSRLTEFSVEANPNTFDPDRAAALKNAGVNRLSFGAQSFIPAELQTLQRDHNPENVPRAFDIAQNAGITNLNLDLIFGIPGQTLDSWNYSLNQALQLGRGAEGPSHMSCYSLTYEPNTAMTARLKKGEFTPINEDLELAMFNHVYETMRAHNFTRYEISNYARPGKECQHNILYWKAANWLAWGPAAAGHIQAHRWKNIPSLTHYINAVSRASCPHPPAVSQASRPHPPAVSQASRPHPPAVTRASCPHLPLTQMEHLTPRAWAAETALFWLRLTEGLNYAEFHHRTGIHARPLLEPALHRYADLNFVELHPTHVRLTEKAIPVSNPILAAAFEAFK